MATFVTAGCASAQQRWLGPDERLAATGKITEFALPVPRSGPLCVTPGKDGKIWFTESYGAIGYLLPQAGG